MNRWPLSIPGNMVVRALLLVCLDPVGIASAQDPVSIARFRRPPVMDGTLNDPAWRLATVFTDFTVLHSQPGREPAERTEAYLAYDSTRLYVGIRSLDGHPDSIRALATGPDSAKRDDWVAFCLDPQDQGLDAYCLLVTPRGIRLPATLDYGGSPTNIARLPWRSAASRTPGGYTVEIAIPFAQLPHASGDRVAMAFKAVRFVSRRHEESDAPSFGPGAQIAQFTPIALTGILPSAVRADRPLFDVHAQYREKLRNLARFGDSTLEGRVRSWIDASVLDYRLFASRPLQRSGTPFFFARSAADDTVAARLGRLEYLPGRLVGDLDWFLRRTLTTSLIVIRNDTILYEKYFNGWARDSTFTSFSVAKAFVSTLVGIAVDRGEIHSLSDSVTAYLPELARRDPRFNRITVRDLLRMSSGLRYADGEPPYDDDRTYLDPDMRRAALEGSTIVEEPGKHWLYCNYNPLLLGLILERASGRTVTDLLQSELWSRLGMEFGGSWSLDSRQHGFEKMESGINARSIDYAKLGRLFLSHGTWNGVRIVSASWIEEASQPWPAPGGYYEDEDFFGRGGHYFGYFLWGDRRDGGESDFHTVGNKGQYVYVSPQKQLIIVRTGIQFGLSSGSWLRLFRAFADQF